MPIETAEPELTEARTRAGVKRLNFILSDTAYRELQQLAKESRRSMTELVRYGIGIMKIAIEAQRDGNRLMIVDRTNKAVREIVIPG